MKNHQIGPILPILTLAAICLIADSYGEVGQQILHSFGTPKGDGLQAYGGVVQGGDGVLYGTAWYGGSNGLGTVFRLKPDGTGYSVLHHFLTNGIDGSPTTANVVQGRDGKLYGMGRAFIAVGGVILGGGTNNVGIVFALNTDGTGYQVLHTFPYGALPSGYDAQTPVGSVLQGADGMLYGLYTSVSNRYQGTVFKLNPNNLGYTVIGDAATKAHSDTPHASLIQGRDGALYGTTEGYVYRISTNGFDCTVLHAFTPDPAGTNVDAYYSFAPLLQGADGMLYGTSKEGGRRTANHPYGCGTVFKLSPSGTDYQVIHMFGTNDTNIFVGGISPVGGLTQGSDGALYGTTSSGGTSQGGTMFKLNPDGTGFRVLYDFVPPGSYADGWDCQAAVVQGQDGAFYGTTAQGGASGYGVVFKIGGDFTVLSNFGANATDVVAPSGALAQGADGMLFGTSQSGGTNGGFGTVYRVNPNGIGRTVIYSFSQGPNGSMPSGGLLAGKDGSLYGTTAAGGNGASSTPFSGVGTVFKLSSSSMAYSTIYRFNTNGTDGQRPSGPLIQAGDGTLYGTTSRGGSNNVGTVYKLDASGSSYSVLYTFKTNGNDGQIAGGGVIQGRDGVLYGVTGYGGSDNVGTVFRLQTDGGGYAILHHFTTSGSGGQQPRSGVVQASDGALYGTTYGGGSHNVGTVFRLTTDGTSYVALHSFRTNDNDGQKPSAPLIQAGNGALYGTTTSGGTSSYYGTVFRLYPDGSGYTVVHSFGDFDGGSPQAPLLLGSDGAVYGTTSYYGPYSGGNLFRLAVTSGQFTSFALLPNGTIQASINGGNLDYRVDASTDLVNWVTLTNFVNTASTVQFVDPYAANYPRRFYRTVWVP